MPAVDKLESPARADAPRPDHVLAGGVSRSRSLFDREILAHATVGAVAKVDPRVQVKNSVMLVVRVGTVVPATDSGAHPSVFARWVTAWLALTVFCANYGEGVADGRGKAQAAT